MEDLTSTNKATAKSKTQLAVNYAIKFLLIFSGLCVGAVAAILIALLTGLVDLIC